MHYVCHNIEALTVKKRPLLILDAGMSWVSRMAMIFQTVVAIPSLAYTIATIRSLMDFLSFQDNVYIKQLMENASEYQQNEFNIWLLLQDAIMCYLFIFQHSLMATKAIKTVFSKLGLSVLQRSIYCLCTSLTLNLIITKWRAVICYPLWLHDTGKSDIVWWIFTSIQYFGWMIIFGGCVMMDLGEILGIKQVWYSINDLPDPMTMKSRELQSLYKHMRHPSVIGLSIILWIHPHMTLDRLLLAFIFTVYMLGFFTIDNLDYAYQRKQLLKKQETIYKINVEKN